MSINAQVTLTGQVIDEDTKEGVPFCNVYFEGTTIGVSTDVDGFYKLYTDEPLDSLSVSAMGYETLRKPITNASEQVINFKLSSSELTLTEVVVVAGENPANAIVRGIIENKSKNRISNFDTYQCESYTKVELDLDNIDEKLRKSKLFKPFEFIFETIDSTSDERPFLPAYIMESIADVYHSKGEGKPKEILKARKISGVENPTVADFINKVQDDYDVYDNWINILDKPIVSPFSNSGLFYYEYYIMDSVYVSGKLCRKLKFKPKRKQENTFYGHFWVVDSSYAIQRLDMRMSPDVNINLVSRVIIYQEYNLLNNDLWVPKKQKTVLDFRPTKQVPGLIGRKTISYKDFRLNQSEIQKFYQEKNPEDVNIYELAKEKEYWDENRHEKLSKNEAIIYATVDSVKNVPMYKTYVDVIYTLTSGLKKIGPIEIGPYWTLYNNNTVEGHRFKLGAWTNLDFSKKVRFGGYLAYGTKDKRLKSGADFHWNITNFPRSKLIGSYKYDVNFSHANSEDLGEGNLFSGVYRRKIAQKLTLAREAKLSYEKFWKKGWSIRSTFLHQHLDPYGEIDDEGNGFNYKYLPDPEISNVVDTTVTTTELIFKLKYAYKEKVVEGAFYRTSLGSRYPIVELQYAAGIKGLLGGDYNYHKLTFAISHWFDIKPIGWSKYVIKAGKTFNQVPFLLAEVHPGNETYFYGPEVFNGMNRYEFASDTYVSFMYNHNFDGFILNKIPLIRKLKWRTVTNFRAVWGTMSNQNRNANQLNLFDETLDGKKTYTGFVTPSDKPYMEAGVGITNILKILRVDALWRLNYLENPDADKFTFRLGMEFYF